MLLWFYRLPLWFVFLGTFIYVIIYGKLSEVFFRKPVTISIFKILNLLLLTFSLSLIAYATIINRPNITIEVILQPFQSFLEAKVQPEMYRTMWMNVVLFVPFGVAFSNIFREKSYMLAITVTFICGLLISIAIEYIQFSYSLGLVQTDDVLCNGFGALIGSISVIIKKICRFNTINKLYFE